MWLGADKKACRRGRTLESSKSPCIEKETGGAGSKAVPGRRTKELKEYFCFISENSQG